MMRLFVLVLVLLGPSALFPLGVHARDQKVPATPSAFQQPRQPGTPFAEGQLWEGHFNQESKFGNRLGKAKVFILAANNKAFNAYWVGEQDGKPLLLTMKGEVAKNGKVDAKLLDAADGLFSTIDGTVLNGRMKADWEYKIPKDAVGTLKLKWSVPARTKHGITTGQVLEGNGTHFRNGAPMLYKAKLLILDADEDSFEALWLHGDGKTWELTGTNVCRLKENRGGWSYSHKGYNNSGVKFVTADGAIVGGKLKAKYENDANNNGNFDFTLKK